MFAHRRGTTSSTLMAGTLAALLLSAIAPLPMAAAGAAVASDGSRQSVASPARAAAMVAAVPRPDHTVVLILENHSSGSILGNAQAPYLNELATSGASLTQSFGVTHPSQPNYLALFSGSVSGVVDDSCPHSLPDANLATQLVAAGLTFATYSEDLPSVGYTGCTFGKYARKHNPVVDYPAVAAAANQPLTAFPTDFSALPTVSYVVPNLVNDMHDGTIAQADAWVQAHLKPYRTWAETHNSLLVVTWDEDDYTASNRIPTFFVGAGVVPGNYSEHITHYNVLRTLQDAYGLGPQGASATAAPILDIWAPPTGAPSAAFSLSCTALSCTADGATSTGGVTSYSWNWGDGTPVTTGVSDTHSYAAAGDFQVSLTVRNAAGLTDVVNHPAAPRTAADPGVLAADAFARAVPSGFGNADIGGAWTVSGSASRYSVAGGTGQLGMPIAGTTSAATLPGVSSSDTDLRVSVATDKLASGNGTYVGLVGRQVSATANYSATVRLRGDGAVLLSLGALQGSSTAVTLRAAVPLAGVVVAAGDVLRTRLQVTGTNPTTVRLKVWPRTGTEPTGWQLSATDSYAGLQRSGAVGLTGYLSGGSTNAPVTLRISELTARSSAIAPVNAAPTARFTLTCSDLSCTANGTGSTDGDGTVSRYAWNWGDGTAGSSGSSATHRYGSPGSFPVTLTVTDNAGATGTSTATATPSAPPVDQPPVAIAAVSCLNLVCSADGSASTDPDGAVAGYAWSWGDGSTGAGLNTSHAYQAAGTYLVTLTVTDDAGLTDSGAVSVSPTLATNVPPKPSIGVSCVALACSADSSGSVDPDGTVTAYRWDWGDGTPVTSGPTGTHSYAAAGSFTVTLTETDNRGGTAAITQTVTVTGPPPVSGPFAADAFARTVAGGWGAAPVGGPWTVTGGAANFSMGNGIGLITVAKAGGTVGAVLPGAPSPGTSTDFTLAVATDKLADNSGSYFTFLGRRLSSVLDYDSRVRVTGTGAVVLSLGALTGTTTSVALSPQVVVPGLALPAGGWLKSRLQVTGSNPTTIRAKVWSAAAAEPAGWQLTATDATPALQVPGAIGLTAYVSSSATNAPITVKVRDVAARPVTP